MADRISQLEGEVFNPPFLDDLATRAATMQEAADLAKTTFGERHWLTILKQSLADGMKSIAILPPIQQKLYLDALNAQLTGSRLASKGEPDVALKELRRAHEMRMAAIGPDHILTAYTLLGISTAENRLGAGEVAKNHSLAIVRVAAEQWGKDHPGYAHALRNLAWAECLLHEFEAAANHLSHAIAILEPVLAEGLSEHYILLHAAAHHDLARARNEQGRFAEAEIPARRAIEVLAIYPQSSYVQTLESLIELARSESGQGKFMQAEITFVAMRRIQPAKGASPLAAYLTAAYDEHRQRVREGAVTDRPLNRQ